LGRLPDQQSKGLMEQYATEKFNPHAHNQKAATNEQSRSIARGLLVEAEMLEIEARKKRDQAYKIDANLRPQVANVEMSSAERDVPCEAVWNSADES
jgi:hypothetical protein